MAYASRAPFTRVAAMRVLFAERVRPLDHYIGLLGMLTELSDSSGLTEIALTEASAMPDNYTTETAARLLAYIHENAVDPALSFDRVARAVGMSRATFGRAFPRLFGKTFVKYLAEVRVKQACTLLAETDRSVTEIATGTGFGSLSNFNRQFLALKRTTPLSYRKSVLARHAPRV